jgi:hypothetical protein
MPVPELVLEGGGLGCGRSRKGVRVDLGQRKVPESEAEPPDQALLDPFDLSKRLTRVRAFVTAVLHDQAAGRRAADLIDRFVKRL